MNKKNKILSLAILLLVTVSCGFQPIYQIGNKANQTSEFSLNFYNEPSYETKNIIKSAFQDPQENVLYSINLAVEETQTPLIINSNGTVSKYRVKVVLTFEVVNILTSNIVYKNIVRGFGEYLVQESEYATEEKKKQVMSSSTNEAVQLMLTKIQANLLSS